MLDEYIDYLNYYGALSTSFLIRKFKMSARSARKILISIIQEFENVLRANENQIFIIGRAPHSMQQEENIKRLPRKPRTTSRWKDVTKPYG